MGRKLRGAALRAQKRATATSKEMVEEAAKCAEQHSVTEQSNQELFVIDTTGDSKTLSIPKIASSSGTQKTNKKDKSIASLIEQRMVETLVQNHSPEALKAMAKMGQGKLQGKRRTIVRGHRKPKFDLWGDEGCANGALVVRATNEKQLAGSFTPATTAGVKRSHVVTKAQQISKKPKNSVAVHVARGGQSYRPDPKQHKQVVRVAVSLEVRRQEAQERKEAPLATGMSAETRALLVGDSSSDEEQDNNSDDEQQVGEDIVTKLQKRPEKLTRAERNKQKRLRIERAIQENERKNKKLLNSVAELPRYKNELNKGELKLQEKQNQRNAAKDQQTKVPGKDVEQKVSTVDPIHAPTLPVALTSEHRDSSLRTIKPKGSLVTDRMASFVDRNLVSKRKMGDKKRIMQGKRRKLNVKGRGHDIAMGMDMALMG